MGFTYLGPVDGHDTENLIYLLKMARDMRRPVVLHVMTKKGKGYAPAEEHPKLFHGIGKFDPETGTPLKKSDETFSSSFGNTMIALAKENPYVCAITAAMPGGTGLLDFKSVYPNRIFDVGIAEEHAVSMAGGLAKQGMVPVVAIYSTFLQRAYDMILQDVCMLGLHVVFAVDRAGLVGEDGETHHGIFDIGFLRHAPGLTILCPASQKEQKDMLCWAVTAQEGPVAIRYPRGGNRNYVDSAWDQSVKIASQGLLTCHRSGSDVTLITYGTLLQNVMEAADILAQKGIQATVLRLLTVQPLPIEDIQNQMVRNRPVIVVEEVSARCGIYEALASAIQNTFPGCQVAGMNLGYQYVQHGAVEKLYQHYGLDAAAIAAFAEGVQRNENQKTS